MKLEFHELANVFPLIEGKEFDNLVADIKENGLLERIVILNGQILDGRNRFRACIAGGLIAEDINPSTGMWFQEFNEQNFGADAVENGPLPFVLSKNLNRRHLDESQRAMVASRLATLKPGRPGEETPSREGVSAEDAAKSLNVGRASVERAKTVHSKGTAELIHAVEQGKLTVNAAAMATKLSPELQREAAIQAEAGDRNAVRNTIKKGLRAAREADLGQKMLALPDKQYGVILADPEWEFVVWSNITGLDRSALNHYDVSPWEKIAARDVQKIAAKDCLLCLWVTDLARGLRVLEAWGFEYKSYFVWAKDIVPCAGLDLSAEAGGGSHTWYKTVGAPGTGYWNRDRDEIMLIGTRGKVVAPAMGTQGESIWFAARPKVAGTQRGRHSAKPENAHLWIEQHYPNTPKIELNARQARAGWDVWGYEAPGGGIGSGATASETPADLSTDEADLSGDEPGASSDEAETTSDTADINLSSTSITSGVDITLASIGRETSTDIGNGDLDLGEAVALYSRALAVVLQDRKASTSYVQRRLGIGYNRATALIAEMEQSGLVSGPNFRGVRDILVDEDVGEEFTGLLARCLEGDADAIVALPGAAAERLQSARTSVAQEEPKTRNQTAAGSRLLRRLAEPLDEVDLDKTLPAFMRRDQPKKDAE